jgi:hypothetical protein
MKKEITIPDHLPFLKEEGSKAAAKRREEYSFVRDLQAKEYNEAIASRLAKENKSKNKSNSDKGIDESDTSIDTEVSSS